MLAEALDYISKLSRQSGQTTVIRPDAEPPDRYLLCTPDGKTEWKTAYQPRKHVAGSLKPVVHYCTDQVNSDFRSAIWFNRNGVVGVLVDESEGRRDRVTFKLNLSPQILTLNNLEKTRPWLSQRDFVRLLKVDLAGCLAPSGNILDIVRTVKFVNNANGESVIAHGKSSVGRAIQQEVTGAGNLPEYLKLDVPIFHQGVLGVRAFATCSLDVDPANSTFQLTPLPSEIERAVVEGERQIGEIITDLVAETAPEGKEFVGIHYGQPE